MSASFPIEFDLYPSHGLSRRLALAKPFLVTPHLLIVACLLLAHLLLSLASIGPILVTGRYPPRLFSISMQLLRWSVRVFGYSLFLTDAFPPFSGKPMNYPVTFDLQ